MPSFSQIFATEHAAHQATVARLPECLLALERISDAILTALRSGRKILFFGNGGSAADAQHLAAEFVIRYRTNRVSLPAIALTTDSSVLTACGNDFGFDTVFARQVEGIAQAGDVVIGITTSGSSKNVVAGLEMAKSKLEQARIACSKLAVTPSGCVFSGSMPAGTSAWPAPPRGTCPQP